MFALFVLRKNHPTVIEMLLTGWRVATVKSGYTYYVTMSRTEVIMFAACVAFEVAFHDYSVMDNSPVKNLSLVSLTG